MGLVVCDDVGILRIVRFVIDANGFCSVQFTVLFVQQMIRAILQVPVADGEIGLAVMCRADNALRSDAVTNVFLKLR